MSLFPFQTIDWSQIERVVHPGETGQAFWQTHQLEGLRLRMVEYSAGYVADHWCSKGHIVHCLEGSFISELSTGENIALVQGQTYGGFRRNECAPIPLRYRRKAVDHRRRFFEG